MPKNCHEATKEFRDHRRASLLAEVSCQSQMSFGFGKIENISETGLLINSPGTLPLGSEIEIQFILPVHPQAVAIKAKAKIVWVRPRVAMGIQFLDLSPEYRAAVSRFVQQTSA
jgi:c-di-GMP-binding flagellar brake protein YcgR